MTISERVDAALLAEVESAARAVWRVGTDAIADTAELDISPCGGRGLFTATIIEALEGPPANRIMEIDLATGVLQEKVGSVARARQARYAPTSGALACITDRAGDGALTVEIWRDGEPEPRSIQVDGWVDQFLWSHDATQILMVVADHGADRAGVQGAARSLGQAETKPSWWPLVDVGAAKGGRRRLWLYDCADQQARSVGPPDLNIWEAAWCGAGAAIAVASQGATEGDWYEAQLVRIAFDSDDTATLLVPEDQLGWPAASASGERIAVVEAICSDRMLVAGALRVIDAKDGATNYIDPGFDVTDLHWLDETHLLLAGHRGLETLAATLDLKTSEIEVRWRSATHSIGGAFAKIAPLGREGDFALIIESFAEPPEIGVVEPTGYRRLCGFERDLPFALPRFEPVRWQAPDGLDLEGWLLRPEGSAPHPTIMSVHGGPAWHWRPRWLGRFVGFQDLMLVARGFAIFLPNPRGSTGRGRAFAALARGDAGGADADDLLSGLDHLVAGGLADPGRLGVCGGSYGGYMAAWLPSRTDRFAAAAAVAPIINPVTERLLASLPRFAALYFGGSIAEPESGYYSRSPLVAAANIRTPMLQLCGALDRVTPPEEARQLHAALVAHNRRSVLVTYPQEGHGVRNWPAFGDYAARLVGWFVAHIGAAAP